MGPVAVPASHVLDRLSQPPGGRVPMAGVLDDVPTWCPAHHTWGRDAFPVIACSFYSSDSLGIGQFSPSIQTSSSQQTLISRLGHFHKPFSPRAHTILFLANY